MRVSTRIRVAVAALTFASAGAALVTTAPQAAAGPALPETAAAASAPLHDDACGPRWAAFVPDSGPIFNFHEPCHWHDWCYAAKPYGRNEWGRAQCDAGFYSRMLDSCGSRYPNWWQIPLRSACNNVASTYYAAVVAAGAASFYLT